MKKVYNVMARNGKFELAEISNTLEISKGVTVLPNTIGLFKPEGDAPLIELSKRQARKLGIMLLAMTAPQFSPFDEGETRLGESFIIDKETLNFSSNGYWLKVGKEFRFDKRAKVFEIKRKRLFSVLSAISRDIIAIENEKEEQKARHLKSVAVLKSQSKEKHEELTNIGKENKR